MLVKVPMSICGALIFASLGLTSLNIHTEVGLLTLIGLIAKHGILIVEFANQLQDEGKSRRQAIEEAAAIRLRPILMTTAATVLAIRARRVRRAADGGSSPFDLRRQAMDGINSEGLVLLSLPNAL